MIRKTQFTKIKPSFTKKALKCFFLFIMMFLTVIGHQIIAALASNTSTGRCHVKKKGEKVYVMRIGKNQEQPGSKDF